MSAHLTRDELLGLAEPITASCQDALLAYIAAKQDNADPAASTSQRAAFQACVADTYASSFFVVAFQHRFLGVYFSCFWGFVVGFGLENFLSWGRLSLSLAYVLRVCLSRPSTACTCRHFVVDTHKNTLS